uniref:Uncharacterized protein n=1 Tax=Solanum lycopersicum TaxID=4081 RepID=A0A3Q7HM62_SOLLC
MPAEEPTPHANVSFAHVSSQVPKDKPVYPDIVELKQHMKEYVDSKFEYLVNLIKTDHIEDMGGKSTPHMVEVSDEEGNDGYQATSPIQMEFTEDTLKNHQVMKDVSELQSPNSNSHHTDETCEHSKTQFLLYNVKLHISNLNHMNVYDTSYT